MSKLFSHELLNRIPIIGIMRNVPGQHMETIAKTYLESGLTCLEVTMNSPDAEKHIDRLVELFGGNLNIGAGTVCSMNDLDKALAANAMFIVTPIINEAVIKACVEAKIPVFPGAYTPSEIYKAWELGATMVKLFPAGDVKPGYIKDILAPLNFISLIPTGGVTIDNFTNYLAEGARAVGIGSHLFPKDIIERQDWSALSAIYTQFVQRYTDFAGGLQGFPSTRLRFRPI